MDSSSSNLFYLAVREEDGLLHIDRSLRYPPKIAESQQRKLSKHLGGAEVTLVAAP